VINVLSRVPTLTGGGCNNILSVEAIVKVVVIRTESANCNYLLSGQGENHGFNAEEF